MDLHIPKWLTAFKITIQDTLIADEQPLVVEQLILRLRRSKASFVKMVDQLRTPKLMNQFLEDNPLLGLNDDNPLTYERSVRDEQEQHQLSDNLAAVHSQMIQLSKDLQLQLSACVDRLHILSVQFNMAFSTPEMPQRAKELQHHVPVLCGRLMADLVTAKEQAKINISTFRLEAQHAQDLYECFSQMDAEINELKNDMDMQVQLICAMLARMAH